MNMTAIIIEAVKAAVLPACGSFAAAEFAKLTDWLDVGDRRAKLRAVALAASAALAVAQKIGDGTFQASDANAAARTAASVAITAAVGYAWSFLQHKLSKAARGI